MIVAITGGTGFIGRNLVRKYLQTGATVRVLTRKTANESGMPKEVILCRGDLTGSVRNLLPFVNNADLLFHCAAEINDPARMYSVHVIGTKNLIEAARGRLARWIQLSSVGVYGSPRSGMITEDTPINPKGTYETTKTESDYLVMEAAARDTLRPTILRPSNVFGEDMANRSLFQLISIISKGLFFFIGKPGASANYIHVDNVVEALFRCGLLAEAAGKTYNLSDWCSIEDFVEIIARALRKPVPSLRLSEGLTRKLTFCCRFLPGVPLTVSRIDALTGRHFYAIERIQKELKYKHVVPMERAIYRMVNSWKLRNCGANINTIGLLNSK